MSTRTPNRTRQNANVQTPENSSGPGEETTTPTPAALIRRRDTRTGVVIRVAPSHPFATDNGWETITGEKSA